MGNLVSCERVCEERPMRGFEAKGGSLCEGGLISNRSVGSHTQRGGVKYEYIQTQDVHKPMPHSPRPYMLGGSSVPSIQS